MNEQKIPTASDGLLDRPITFIANKTKKTGSKKTVRWFFEQLKGEEHRAKIEEIRGSTPTGAAKLKSELPAVMFAGYFASRAVQAKKSYLPSGLLSLDFDNLGEGGARRLKADLLSDGRVLLAFISPSGRGVKAVVPFIGGASYGQAFDLAAAYYLKKFKVQCDKACRDATRLCFLSYDSSPALNEQAMAHVFGANDTPPSPLLSSTTYNPTPCALHPTPYTLHPTPYALHPTPYTLHPTPYALQDSGRVACEAATVLSAENAARKILDAKRSEEHGPVWVYEKLILGRHPAKTGKRNEWLQTVSPLLFRAASGPVAERVVELFHDINSSLFKGTKKEHMDSFGTLWAGCEASYMQELATEELYYYNLLEGPEKAALRICRDLKKDNGQFFMPSEHMGWRIGTNGWRVLNKFERHGVISVLKRGQRREAGIAPRATTYRWMLSTKQKEAA